MFFHGVVLSVLTCICWGSTSICLRGLKTLDPYEMSLLRAIGGFAASVPLAFFFSSGAHLYDISAQNIVVLLALVLFNNVIGDVFLFIALHKLGVARGSSIASTYPVIVAIFSYLWFGEQMTFPVITGTISVVIGVICLCQKIGSKLPMSPVGLIFAMLAAFFWAIGLLFNKFLLKEGVTPDVIVLGRGITFLITAFLIWGLRLAFFDKGYGAWKNVFVPEASWAVLAGVLSLGVGAWTYSSALEIIPASVATPIGASNPLLATILAIFIFKERISCIQWFGIVMAVGGSILVTL